MDDIHERKIGKWDPERNQFRNRCPVCRLIFYGRKNRVYCSEPCKNRRANDLSIERREEVRDEMNIYQLSAKVLKRFYPLSRGEQEIPMQQLIAAGFEPWCPHILRKLKDREGQWRMIGKYALQTFPSRDTVIIIKIK